MPPMEQHVEREGDSPSLNSWVPPTSTFALSTSLSGHVGPRRLASLHLLPTSQRGTVRPGRGAFLQAHPAGLPGLCPTFPLPPLGLHLHLPVSVSTIVALSSATIAALTASALHQSLFRALLIHWLLEFPSQPQKPISQMRDGGPKQSSSLTCPSSHSSGVA